MKKNMRIDIEGTDFFMVVDDLNIILKENKEITKPGHDRLGERYERVVGYYYCMEHALMRVLDQGIIQSGVTNIEGLIGFIKDTKKSITNMCAKLEKERHEINYTR